MTARIVAASLALAVCALGSAYGQDQIEPDRPDVTNGTHLVDTGLLQIEIGALYARPSGGTSAFGSPLTARVGLTDWLEARIGSDGFVTDTDGATRHSSIGNTNLGAKLRLWADPGGIPVLSVLPALNMPTANSATGFSSGEVDYTVVFLTGSDVGRHWHVDGNYGIGRIGVEGGRPRFTQHLASVSVSVAATDNLNPYAESFWLSKQDADGAPIAALDAGAIYELGARYAVDGGMQVNVAGSARELAVFGGVSFIVGNILGNHGVHARQRQMQRRRERARTPRR